MKKHIIILLGLIFIAGCSCKIKQKEILAKVNNYEITKQEFEEAFKDTTWQDTLDSRKEFLESLIKRKLILQEAQKQGLDRQESFLKAIEHFWEQSLLKITLDKKVKVIGDSLQVSEEEIRQAYDRMSDVDKAGKSLEGLRGQIKWELRKAKESKNIENWLSGLRQKAKVDINYNLLK